MITFNKKYTVPYFHTDNDGYLRFPYILAYMAETSSWHSDSIGAGVDELAKRKMGWMLNRWEVKVLNYPIAKDELVVSTWTSGFNKFYASREFLIEDKSGEIMVKASTQWILIDMIKKRPIRIPQDFIDKYGMIEKRNFETYTEFTNDLSGIDFTSEFTIRRSDIDSNNHVNNTKYTDWIIEDVADEIYNGMRIEEFAVIYKKEILEGSNIYTGYINNEGIFLHKVGTSEEINAIIMTKWEKKD